MSALRSSSTYRISITSLPSVVLVYTHAHTHTHTHTCMYTHMRIHTYIYIHIHIPYSAGHYEYHQKDNRFHPYNDCPARGHI